MKAQPLALVVIVIAVALFLQPTHTPVPVSAQGSGNPRPVVRHPEKSGVSPALRSLPKSPAPESERRLVPLHRLGNRKSTSPQLLQSAPLDPVLQNLPGRPSMPIPLQNFEGNNQSSWIPPDANGDIGYDASTSKKYYVQTVNTSFQIWDVTSTPTSVVGPIEAHAFFSPLGAPCGSYDRIGDPIVLFDRLASRWLISLFGDYGDVNGYHQCIAISLTADPTGFYYLYDYLISSTKFNDYPKFAVWHDAYYLSIILFGGGSYGDAGAIAFERAKMLTGDASPGMLFFDTSLFIPKPNLGAMLPSNFNGATAPPAGAPNYFVQFDDNADGYPQDQLEVWQFHVDWVTPANSTFAQAAALATASFDSYLANIPQLGTAQLLDVLSDRLMYSLQYRNFGAYETLVVNQTVDVNDFSNHAGVRWYELRKSGGVWAIYQQGTFAPDSKHRWMGSIAMDGQGNMALGYSVSSPSMYPAIRYAGRLADDPLGTLPQFEVSLIEGTGYQTTYDRWGDYTSMSVDPVDDCTFWYTNEYYTSPGINWRTRIGAFKLCSPGPPLNLQYFFPIILKNTAP
jgi:hypothetical protein